MIYTSDWFTPHIPSWQAILIPALAGKPCNALEIGSYEGRSMVWLLENALTHPASRLTCVDTWCIPGIEQRFDANAVETGASHKVQKCKGDSSQMLRSLHGQYDLIYIDGDHSCQGVLIDTVLTIRQLKSGGIVIWDDYNHPGFPGCGKAVNILLDAWSGELEILAKGRQVIARKIGQLVGSPPAAGCGTGASTRA